MHEFGLTEAIAQTALARADGRSVARVTVRISALLRAETDSMEQAFQMVAAGTCLDGAVLELNIIPGRGTCGMCGSVVEVNDRLDPCPNCGEFSVGGTNDEEMILESVEYRTPAEKGG